MTSPSLTDQLDDLCRGVENARIAIAAGAFVELAGLDTEVAKVVDAARMTMLADRPQVLAALAALLRELDGLTVDLCRQRDAALALQAADAYRTGPGPS